MYIEFNSTLMPSFSSKVNISLDTTKEDELFNYVGVEKEYVRMKHSKLDYGSKENDEKEFELSL